MRRFELSVTNAVAALAALAGVVILALHAVPQAAFGAGFVPARIQGEIIPAGVFAFPAWLTPLTALFVHTNLFHLGFNILILVVTGQKTESAMGRGAFALLIAMGAYAAAGALWAVAPGSLWPLVGLNGAVSAVIGAYSLLYGRPAKRLGPLSARTVQVLWLAAAWIAISLLIALMQPADPMLSLPAQLASSAAAPIGGFLAGLIVARPLFRWHWRKA